jgi:hypothetical protein
MEISIYSVYWPSLARSVQNCSLVGFTVCPKVDIKERSLINFARYSWYRSFMPRTVRKSCSNFVPKVPLHAAQWKMNASYNQRHRFVFVDHPESIMLWVRLRINNQRHLFVFVDHPKSIMLWLREEKWAFRKDALIFINVEFTQHWLSTALIIAEWKFHIDEWPWFMQKLSENEKFSNIRTFSLAPLCTQSWIF